MAKLYLPPEMMRVIIIRCCDDLRQSLISINKRPIRLRKQKHSVGKTPSYFEMMYEINVLEKTVLGIWKTKI